MLKKITKLLRVPLFANAVPAAPKPDVSDPSGGCTENTPECQYLPGGWKPRETDRKGWDTAEIVRHYRRDWAPYAARLQTHGPVNFAPGDPNGASIVHQNTALVFGYALALAASGKTKISMLDWGGAVGHYYLLAKALVPGVEIDYHCKDMPTVVEYGQDLLPDANFYSDHSCLDRRYDFVLVSGSLQFTEDWQGLFADLAKATSGHILVTRSPVVEQSKSFVFAHRTDLYGYPAEFLAWCFNRMEFLTRAQELGLEPIREFLVGTGHSITDAPEQPVYYGFLFKKRN